MYSRDGAIHFSAFKEMAKSPMHYAWRVANPMLDTPSMRLGRAVHALTLQGIEPYVFQGDRRGTKWTEFVAERLLQPVELVDDYYQRDNISDVLTPPEWDRARWMRDRVAADTDAAEILALCQEREVDIAWPMMGHPWKGRIDGRGHGILMDLKSTKCAAKWSFLRDAGRSHYDAQLVAYDIGSGAQYLGTTAETEWSEHRLVAVENIAPFAVQVYATSNLRKDQAAERLTGWMMYFDACVKAGDFCCAYNQGVIDWDAELIFGGEDDEDEE